MVLSDHDPSEIEVRVGDAMHEERRSLQDSPEGRALISDHFLTFGTPEGKRILDYYRTIFDADELFDDSPTTTARNLGRRDWVRMVDRFIDAHAGLQPGDKVTVQKAAAKKKAAKKGGRNATTRGGS